MSNPVVQIDTGRANVFLVQGQSGCILADAGNPGKADLIVGQLAKHGFAPSDIRLILITHGHTDHFGSAQALRERTGAPVAAHALDAGAVRQGVHQPDSLQPTGWLIALLAACPVLRKLAVSHHAPPLEPDIVFEGKFRLDEYGVTGQVIPTPGHTPGASSVLLDSGEAIVGDAVMGKLMGLLHKPGPPVVAWDLERNWEIARQLLELSPRTIYVGHGGPFAAADVSDFVHDKTSQTHETRP